MVKQTQGKPSLRKFGSLWQNHVKRRGAWQLTTHPSTKKASKSCCMTYNFTVQFPYLFRRACYDSLDVLAFFALAFLSEDVDLFAREIDKSRPHSGGGGEWW